MISKNQRQLILNLIEKYGDLREKYGRNSKNDLSYFVLAGRSRRRATR